MEQANMNAAGQVLNLISPSDFLESSAKCIQSCADEIAAGLASVPDEEKKPHESAFLRNWLRVFALRRSRWGWK